MQKAMTVTVLGAFVLVWPILGQGPGSGGLPQEVQRSMEQSMRNLDNQGLMTTRESLVESVGQEKLEAFLEGSLVRLTLFPDGTYSASFLEGGDLVAFRLGKQKIATGEEAEMEDDWYIKSGSFDAPKRAQPLSMTISARGRETIVECYNKFAKAEEPVTFYVGPLDGLFCMGLAEEATG